VKAAARDRAVAFVGAHGDDFAVWRARNLVGDRSLAELPTPPDGWLHADAGDAAPSPARWNGLLAVVGALADVQGLHLPVVEQACRSVADAQCEDGGFEAGAGEDDRIFLTGMLAGLFGKTRFARAGMLATASDFLAARFTPERVQGFAWPAIAAYAHTFANVPHEAADGVLQWVGRELERGFRTGHFDGVRSARVLLYADASSLPGGRLDAAELVEAILVEQEPDGGWLRLEDPSLPARVEQTLDALTALTRFA
jgi:hypothetical protein